MIARDSKGKPDGPGVNVWNPLNVTITGRYDAVLKAPVGQAAECILPRRGYGIYRTTVTLPRRMDAQTCVALCLWGRDGSKTGVEYSVEWNLRGVPLQIVRFGEYEAGGPIPSPEVHAFKTGGIRSFVVSLIWTPDETIIEVRSRWQPWKKWEVSFKGSPDDGQQYRYMIWRTDADDTTSQRPATAVFRGGVAPFNDSEF